MADGILSGILDQQNSPAEGRILINGILYERVPSVGNVAPMPQSNFQVEGSGGYGKGLLEGGGMLGYSLPVNKSSSLMPYLSGGGAIGTMNSPFGEQRIREGSGRIGLNYRKVF